MFQELDLLLWINFGTVYEIAQCQWSETKQENVTIWNSFVECFAYINLLHCDL